MKCATFVFCLALLTVCAAWAGEAEVALRERIASAVASGRHPAVFVEVARQRIRGKLLNADAHGVVVKAGKDDFAVAWDDLQPKYLEAMAKKVLGNTPETARLIARCRAERGETAAGTGSERRKTSEATDNDRKTPSGADRDRPGSAKRRRLARILSITEGHDWSLPDWVKRAPWTGISWWNRFPPKDDRFSVSGLSEKKFSWAGLNPKEGQYRFDVLKRELDRLNGTDKGYGLRCQSIIRDKVPDWVMEKHHPPTMPYSRSDVVSYKMVFVAPWHPGVLEEYTRFVKAFGESGVARHPRLYWVYVHGISRSRGEEMGLPQELMRRAEKELGLTPENWRTWLAGRVPMWLEAFKGVERKLMWVGSDARPGDPYRDAINEALKIAIEGGAGTRGGFCEMFHYRIGKATAQYIDDDGYLRIDETSPLIVNDVALADENEEYSGVKVKLFGGPECDFHRHMMSFMRCLSMRTKFVLIGHGTIKVNPELVEYVNRTMGRSPESAEEAIAFMKQSEVMMGRGKHGPIKNFETFIYQRDVEGGRTVPVERVDRPKAIRDPANMYYDYTARRTDVAKGQHRIFFDVDDRFWPGRSRKPGVLLLKVMFKDTSRAPWLVEYDAGPKGIARTSPVQGTGDGKWKTVTFLLGSAFFAGRLHPKGMDIAVVAGNQDVVVRLVRLTKTRPDQVPRLGEPKVPVPFDRAKTRRK